MDNIVSLETVSKHFGDVVGVDNVSLKVKTGEFVTLLGPSGCGKSTLLRMIGGFEEPTLGRIWLDGQDVTHLEPNRRDLNMVFQDYALFPHMSVGKNVGYGLRVSRLRRSFSGYSYGLQRKNVGYGLRVSRQSKGTVFSQAREALDLVGLADRFDSMPHELSGGQRQRVALARALVRHPKVLLLDEPLSALDTNLREAMQVELRHLHHKVGLTFIMVTHDQDEALAMSDRVLVMRDGRVVQDGAPDDLYDRPESPYVAGFVGTTNLFASDVSGHKVHCHGHELSLPADLTSAQQGLFGFRPEKARLVSPQEYMPQNIYRGIISEILYHGSTARIVIGEGDQSILVDQQLTGADGRGALPKTGDRVAIEIAPEILMSFDREAAE